MDYNLWVAVKTDEPNKAGKLWGYCVECGLMRIKGEAFCVRCGTSRITKTAPKEKFRVYGHGCTASTMGNPNNFDRV